jgi:hypothetical protein
LDLGFGHVVSPRDEVASAGDGTTVQSLGFNWVVGDHGMTLGMKSLRMEGGRYVFGGW